MATRGNGQPQVRKPQLLGPEELLVTRGFVLRLALFVAYAVAPRVFGLHPAVGTAARLIAVFAAGGSLAMFSAFLRHEPAGRGPLNRWDEAMAFNGLALLTHLLQPMPDPG